MLGLQDQVLGYTGECRIDFRTGRITHIVLRTQWQWIDLEWEAVEFEPAKDAFRLRKNPQD